MACIANFFKEIKRLNKSVRCVILKELLVIFADTDNKDQCCNSIKEVFPLSIENIRTTAYLGFVLESHNNISYRSQKNT